MPRERLRQVLHGLQDGLEAVRGLPMGLRHAGPWVLTRLSGGGNFLAEQRWNIALWEEELSDLRGCGLQGPTSPGAPLADEV